MFDAITGLNLGQKDSALGTPDSYTKLLLHMEGQDASTTLVDHGVTGHEITAVGGAELDTAFKKFNTSSCLFATKDSDYLTIPDHEDFNFGSAEFTIDTWMRLEDQVGSFGAFSQYDDVDNYMLFDMWNAGDNDYVQFKAENAGTQIFLNPGFIEGMWVPGTWQHIAVIRGWDGNVNDWSLCVDGISRFTDTISTAMPNLTALFNVGRRQFNAFDHGLHGHIDEFRISKGIARWTENFTPPRRSY